MVLYLPLDFRQSQDSVSFTVRAFFTAGVMNGERGLGVRASHTKWWRRLLGHDCLAQEPAVFIRA
jgi:hypothetical protein